MYGWGVIKSLKALFLWEPLCGAYWSQWWHSAFRPKKCFLKYWHFKMINILSCWIDLQQFHQCFWLNIKTMYFEFQRPAEISQFADFYLLLFDPSFELSVNPRWNLSQNSPSYGPLLFLISFAATFFNGRSVAKNWIYLPKTAFFAQKHCFWANF